MKNQSNGGESIRLTNKTARALREQAKQQKLALHLTATAISLALAVVAVLLGMRRLIYVPVTMLAIILIDALIIMLARGRYLSLTGQAICTEAAARQMRGESAEEVRMKTAKRDLEKIKEDLAASFEGEEEEEDEDLTLPVPVKKSGAKAVPLNLRQESEQEPQMQAAQKTQAIEPLPQRRRRQARLQVLPSEQAK